MKHCSMCRCEMTIHNSSSRSRRCRPCAAAYARERHRLNPERARATKRRYYQAHKVRLLNAGRVQARERSLRSYRERGKAWARAQLKTAVKAGRVCRPEQCYQCHALGRVDGHHEDYSKPLDVVWLCRRCHRERHAAIRAEVLAKSPDVVWMVGAAAKESNLGRQRAVDKAFLVAVSALDCPPAERTDAKWAKWFAAIVGVLGRHAATLGLPETVEEKR